MALRRQRGKLVVVLTVQECLPKLIGLDHYCGDIGDAAVIQHIDQSPAKFGYPNGGFEIRCQKHIQCLELNCLFIT